MARYTGNNCRICRRSGEKLYLKSVRCNSPKCAIERRPNPPGQQISRRKRKMSDRGIQLREKQKARFIYGFMENQFRRLFRASEVQEGPTGQNLLVNLERRLDNVVFRLGLGSSRDQARQLVLHGFLMVNGRKSNIPSHQLSVGDTVAWSPRALKSKYYKNLQEMEPGPIPGWLSSDRATNESKVLSLPKIEDIGPLFNEKSIVEYYSR